MNVDALSAVEDYLRERHAQLPEMSDSLVPVPPLKISPPLDVTEAEDFLSGLKEGLFTIDEDGYAQSELLPSPPLGQELQKLFQLFWHWQGGKRTLFREGVCQLAAASALVLRYGWAIGQVRLEPNHKDLGHHAYGVDLVVFDRPGGRGLIFGEVKANSQALEKLLWEFAECARRGEHTRVDCGHRQHSKFAVCWKQRPSHFWAVCPGTRRAFTLMYSPASLKLEEISDLSRALLDRHPAPPP